MESLTHVPHPSAFISEEISNALAEVSAEAEKMGDLHPAQLEIIFQNKWFGMMVARRYGGGELSLPEVLRIEEGLSWVDGSVGWVVTLCSGAGWFSGFIQEAFARDVFAAERLCLAGSGAASGTAEETADGYRIKGIWKYATGSLHATAFTANCVLVKDGDPLRDDKGKPLVRAFVLFPDEVKVHRRWRAMGMIATASHSFEVPSCIVPRQRIFNVDDDPRIDHPLYHFPFQQMAELTLSINISGMTMRFLDLVSEVAEEKGKTTDALEVAVSRMNRARTRFFHVAERAWDVCETGSAMDDTLLQELSEQSQHLVVTGRQAVNVLFPLCGLSAADTSREINRVWRNINTAGQHAMFQQ